MTAQAGDTAPIPSAADSKQLLRRQLQAQRAALPSRYRHHAAQHCARHALRALRLRSCRHVALYLAYRSELSTAPLIDALLDDGVHVYLPRLVGKQMRLIELHADTALQRNRYGIIEPCGSVHARRTQLDAIVMPLTGFDGAGNRLGTGGGYYDRLLAGSAAQRRPWRLGYAYALQRCDRVSVDRWDIPLHAVCTEHGLQRFT